MTDRYLFSNESHSVVITPVSATDTEITLFDANTFPSPAEGECFHATLFEMNDSREQECIEVIKVTAKKGNTLTVVRDTEAHGAKAYPSASGRIVYCELRLTAGVARNFLQQADTSKFAPASHVHTKEEVGLSNVDNTSDKDKPVSAAQRKAIDSAISLAKSALAESSSIASTAGEAKVTANAARQEAAEAKSVAGGAARIADEAKQNALAAQDTAGAAATAASRADAAASSALAAASSASVKADAAIPRTNGAATGLRMTKQGGTNGGSLAIEKPQTGNSLSGDVILDVEKNCFRIYEGAPPYRGFCADLTTAAAGAGSTLWHNGNLDPAWFMPRGSTQLNDGVDLNTLYTPGVYQLPPNLSNGPPNAGNITWALLYVISGNNAFAQLIFAAGPALYYRVIFPGASAQWHSLIGSPLP